MAFERIDLAGEANAHNAVILSRDHDADHLIAPAVDPQADGTAAAFAAQKFRFHHQPQVDKFPDDVGDGSPLEVGEPRQPAREQQPCLRRESITSARFKRCCSAWSIPLETGMLPVSFPAMIQLPFL